MSQKVMRRINQRRDGILITHSSIPIVDDRWNRAVNGDRPNLIVFRRNANAQTKPAWLLLQIESSLAAISDYLVSISRFVYSQVSRQTQQLQLLLEHPLQCLR